MTTPTPPDFGSAAGAGSRLLGTNALQAVVDKLSQAVDKLASVTQSMSSSGGSSTAQTTTSYHSTGQTFTSGNFPRMSPAAAAFSGGGSYATAPGGATANPAGTLASAGQAIGQNSMAMMSGSGSQYGQQITMNQYASMSMLGAGPGVSLKNGFSQMYAQAFGSYNKNLNAIATNPADAAQMYSNLQGIAASPFVNSTALGRAGSGASAAFGIANPAMGGAAASQAAASVYSGQTSMLMRMYGYGASPRAGMGQANPMSMGQTAQTILQRAYGGQGSVSQKTLNAGLANNGKLRLNLQAVGLDPNTMGPALQTYNKLFSQGLNANQSQTLLNDAAHNQNYGNQGSAQKLLSNKYGIPTSDLQKLKDTTAVQTGRTSGEMVGFDSAISSATTSVQKFDDVLNTILKATGLGSALGASHGFSGTMNAVGGALGGLFSKGTRALGTLTGISGGAAGSVSTTGHGTPGSTTNKASGAAGTAIKDAESQLGRAYVWGGDNPSVGFDCSGLVEWAYGQAGIKLPRTSQAQWAALKGRSVDLGKVQAGDILFSAGSDGSPNNPGHEAMAISSSQLIEAPHTGANIRIRALNAGEWSHAARPAGSMNASGGGSGSGSGAAGTNASGSSSGGVGQGNGGLGMAVGNYGSSDELSNTASALMGGISGGSGMAGYGGTPSGGAGAGSGKGNSAGGSGKLNVSTAGGGSAAANRALGQKMAKQMYGWVGANWKALDSLWGTYESGWRNDAQNPGSTAYGIGQFLDSTWKPYGPKTSNAGLQIKYGLEYVHDRYKNPVDALKFELSHTPHWYADGIDHAKAGMALVGERGPELVRLGGGQQVLNAGKTADILKGSHAKPGQTPWSAGTTQQLFLAPTPQNQGRFAGKCEVHLNMPPGAIVIHSQGNSTDVSSNVRQIMDGITRAMADDEMVKKIMAGVMG